VTVVGEHPPGVPAAPATDEKTVYLRTNRLVAVGVVALRNQTRGLEGRATRSVR
jgi:hypothetical protein